MFLNKLIHKKFAEKSRHLFSSKFSNNSMFKSNQTQRFFSTQYRNSQTISRSQIGKQSSRLSSTEKAIWTGAGALALVGIGTIVYSGNDDLTTTIAKTGNFAPYVQERISSTYKHVVGSLAITSTSAILAYRSGLAFKFMSMSPMAFGIGSLIATIGTMYYTMSIPYSNTTSKYTAWALFNSTMGISLCTLGVFGGPILLKAAMTTGIIVGSLSLVAANSPSDKFLWMGGPLTIGLGIVFAGSIGQMFFPASAMLHNLVLYGGLGLFGAFVLYDTSRVITAAKTITNGYV